MRVLFVEDNPVNRKVVRSILEIADIGLTEAENAADGLAMIARDDFDLILMDLRMPGMDGLEAIRVIRAMSGPVARLPIVVVTADASPNLNEICQTAGADGVVTKPISIDIFFETIAAAMVAGDARAAAVPAGLDRAS